MSYSNKLNVNILTDLLVKHGVKHAVVCPGSRNAPIVHNLSQVFACVPVTDERSAGFYALGIAQATKKPVVVCVTSGSALLNLYPAVAEAFYQQVPFVVISADRPAAWIDQQDGQTLPQSDALGQFVLKAVSLPEVTAEEPIQETYWFCNRLVNEALLSCYAKQRKGPVHINVPLAEPLYEFTTTELPDERKITCWDVNHPVDTTALVTFFEHYHQSKRPMIVFGQMPSQMALPHLPEKAVCLYEPLSFAAHPHFDEVLSRVVENEEYLPDFLLYIGGEIVSKRLKQFLRKASGMEQWRISEDDTILPDTFMHLTGFIHASPEKILAALVERETETHPSSQNYVQLWRDALGKASHHAQCHQPSYSSVQAVQGFHAQLSNSSSRELPMVVYGNSSAIRLANIYANMPVACNRGVNGIEGTLSTAAGMSLAFPQRQVFCILGDLSFFYDQNALWNTALQGNFRILLLNNSGGGIFGKFEGLKGSNARDLVMARHQTSAQGVCQAHDVLYAKAENESQLQAGLHWLIHESSERPMLLEVITDIDADNQAIAAYYNTFKL